MQDLRLVLVVFGGLAIVGLLIHGMWSSRKNKRYMGKDKPLSSLPPIKQRRRDDEKEDDFDGFDEDGIGKVRVISRRDESELDKPVKPVKPAKSRGFSMPRFKSADESDKPRKREPVMDEPDLSAEPVVEVAAPAKTWRDVYVINVMARAGRELDGQVLLAVFKRLGYRFGEMDIFHRHLEIDGRGDVLFSVVNMVKPGTFDPARMVHFSTPGISLFMQLPPKGRAEAHLKLLLQSAEKLASDLDALLLDAERNPLSELTVSQYFDELKAYDNQ